jgi:hypothetical protein
MNKIKNIYINCISLILDEKLKNEIRRDTDDVPFCHERSDNSLIITCIELFHQNMS